VTSDLICRQIHLRRSHQCNNGARRWFAQHGLSWQKFLADGYPASVLGQWGCPLAQKLIDEAEAEAQGAVILRKRHLDGIACNKGAREWAAEQGIDWASFVERGHRFPADFTSDNPILTAVLERARSEFEET